MEVESGGEIFNVEADRVVLSAGAIKSPHLLMLSGIGPNDQLQQFGIPLVHELPGVGQNLFNHLSAQITFKVKDGMTLAADADAARFCLHYTSDGSSEANDMLLRTTPMVDERPERVPGLRTKFLNDEVPPDRVARISCTLGLPDGSGYVRLASADPSVQPAFNYRYLQHPKTFVGLGKACEWRLASLNPMRIKTWPITGSTQRMTFWPTTTLGTSIYAKPLEQPGMCPAHARWARIQTQWRLLINTAASRE